MVIDGFGIALNDASELYDTSGRHDDLRMVTQRKLSSHLEFILGHRCTGRILKAMPVAWC
jgi:hypothetical protein